MIEVTDEDVGRAVIYVPGHAKGDRNHRDCEQGIITSFSEHSIFVRYGLGSTSAGTDRHALEWM